MKAGGSEPGCCKPCVEVRLRDDSLGAACAADVKSVEVSATRWARNNPAETGWLGNGKRAETLWLLRHGVLATVASVLMALSCESPSAQGVASATLPTQVASAAASARGPMSAVLVAPAAGRLSEGEREGHSLGADSSGAPPGVVSDGAPPAPLPSPMGGTEL